LLSHVDVIGDPFLIARLNLCVTVCQFKTLPMQTSLQLYQGYTNTLFKKL